jgi:hypothetical protein
MTELKLLSGHIYRGNYTAMKDTLENEIPKDATFILEGEPYCNIQSKAALRTLQLVLDDPRFVFDDLFVARQLYFSAGGSRDLVMNHPRFVAVATAHTSFIDYLYIRYGKDAGVKHEGMAQRYYHAELNIRKWKKKKQNSRIVFFLYPALVRHIRVFKQRYYAPESVGYYKSLSHFTSLLQEETLLRISV